MIRKRKSGQEVKIPKRNFPCLHHKMAQEEIIGFGIILVIIAVIALVFISVSANKNRSEGILDDSKSSSFLKAFLETTTSCGKNGKFIPVKDLIFECGRDNLCFDGNSSCEVLNEISYGIMGIWEIGEKNPIKGYELIIGFDDEILLEIKEGNETENWKGAMQDYSKSGENVEVYVKFFN